MNRSRLALASLLLAISAFLARRPPAVDFSFVNPERFSDAPFSLPSPSENAFEQLRSAIEAHLRRLAQRSLTGLGRAASAREESRSGAASP